MHESLEAEPSLHREELGHTWRESLRAQRSTLTTLWRDNIISQETYEALVAEVDAQLIDPEGSWPDSGEAEMSEDGAEVEDG